MPIVVPDKDGTKKDAHLYHSSGPGSRHNQVVLPNRDEKGGHSDKKMTEIGM